MADYAASVLAKAQSLYTSEFQNPEMRYKPNAVLDTLKKQTQFLVPNSSELREREDRPTKAYLKNRTSRALGSSRTHNHTGNVGDSTEVDISYDTYSDTFSTSLKRGDNNLNNNAAIMAHEMRNSLTNLYEGIESSAVAWLDLNKNTVSAPPSGTLQRAFYNVATNFYEIAAGDSEEYLNISKSIFRQEKYSDSMFEAILGSRLYSKHEYYANQGTGNSTNLGFQFSNINAVESIEIADLTYPNGISFFAPTGTIGLLDWIPMQNRSGYGNYETSTGGYGSFFDPVTGLVFAVHGYSERADTSGENGNSQDVVTQWEISIDLSFQRAQITSGASTIFGIAQL